MNELLQKLSITPAAVREQLTQWLPELLAALGILIVFYGIYLATKVPLKRAMRRSHMDETLIKLLVSKIWKWVLMAIGFIMAASNLGINVGAAIAGLGVAGLAVGLAAQDSLTNIIAGFTIFWDKPFRVGHWVTVGGETGEVNEITLRSTRLRTRDNTYVVIPNKNIINDTIVNLSLHGEVRVSITIGIAYKEDIGNARQAILTAIKDMDGVMADPAPDVVVDQLADSAVVLKVRAWAGEAEDDSPLEYRLRETAKTALDAAGIKIPFPQRVVHMDKE